MNPSQSAIDAIRSRVDTIDGAWGGSDESIVAALNDPTIANPDPAPEIPVPYTYADLFGVISQPNLAKLVMLPSLTRIIDDINSGSLDACQRWLTLLAGSGTITPEEAQAVAGVMTATQPSPSWPTHISWAKANIGRSVDADDIAKARP